MIEVGHIYGEDRAVVITFGSRQEGNIKVEVDVPRGMDSIAEIRQYAINEAHRKFKAILDGTSLPLDEEIDALKGKRS